MKRTMCVLHELGVSKYMHCLNLWKTFLPQGAYDHCTLTLVDQFALEAYHRGWSLQIHMGDLFKRQNKSPWRIHKVVQKITDLKELADGCNHTDHGREFGKDKFIYYCDKNWISDKFSATRTPQQNGVAETKNMILKTQPKQWYVKKIFLRYYRLGLLIL